MQAFDGLAASYAGTWGSHPLARLFRARVLAFCAEHFAPGSRVLDLGCGVGIDAAALAALGNEVTAVDASAGMVAQARARGVAARRLDIARVAELAREGPFDGALSNFGALNCLSSLSGFGEGLGACLRPGAVAVLVPMSRRCPAESFALLRRGRRPRRGGFVRIGNDDVPVRYLRSDDVRAALPAFDLLHVEALGALVPPPDLGGRPGRRTALEPFVAGLPVIREWGDHTILVFRRR